MLFSLPPDWLTICPAVITISTGIGGIMDFDDLERRYSAWRVLCESGEISAEEFRRHVDSLGAEDSFGRRWRIDSSTGEWLRLDEGRWIKSDPRLAPAPRTMVEPPTAHPAAAPAKSSFVGWLRNNWGWAAVLAAGIVLVASSIFFLSTLFVVPNGTADQGSATSPTAASRRSPVPVDIQVMPTNTSPPIAPPPGTMTDQGHEMVFVPAGTFRMGTTQEELDQLYEVCRTIPGFRCEQEGFEAELPAHDVTLSAYYLDIYEVTNAQYAAFLTEAGNQTGGGVPWYAAEHEDARLNAIGAAWQVLGNYADHPVTVVTWYGADAYCKARGGRLPSEAEWEKAARFNPETGSVRPYPWGDQRPDPTLANFGLNVTEQTTPVGHYEAGRSALGLYDMAGNVFEWIGDWFTPNYEGAEIGRASCRER